MTLPLETDVAGAAAASATRYRLITELFKTRCGPLWAASDDSGSVMALRPIALSAVVNDRMAAAIAEAARNGLGDRHHALAPIVDVEQGQGELRIVSCYHEGLPLAQLLRLLAARKDAISPAIGMRIALHVLDALVFLHDAGYQPGGLTTENVVVGADGRSRLLEARIASAVSQVKVWAHHRDAVAYRAPEQLQGPSWDAVRAEVFSVGAILWELLVGERLFGGYGYPSVVKMVARRPIPRVDTAARTAEVQVSKAVADVIAWALERDPLARPATIAELASALRDGAEAVATTDDVAGLVDQVIGQAPATERTRKAIVRSTRPARIHVPSGRPTAGDGERASVPEPFRPSSQRRAGRCHLFVEIARGGMATVHLGRWLGVGGFAKTVAVKALHQQYARDPEFVRMFLDEARVVARIRHPNVVATIDLVEEAGELFIIMDYVPSVTLAYLTRRLQRQDSRIPLDVTLRIMTGVLHGLHAAHEVRDEHGASMSVIHRDVSPENVLIGADGYAQLIDFGVASALGRYAHTRDGQIKGKLSYLAPEQITGEPLTRRTDVYSASVVLWQALTGRKLFQVSGLAEMAYALVNWEIPRPSQVGRAVDPALERIVMKGLSREPADRWETAEAMAEALESLGVMASHRATGEWVQAVAERRLARSAAMVQGVESAPAELPSETLARPLSIRPAPPGVLDDGQAEGTVQTWGLSNEGDESTADLTRPRFPSAARFRREHLTLVLGMATAAVIAALIAVAVLGAGDAAISGRVLQPSVPAIVASAVGPGVGGEALTSASPAAAQPTGEAKTERPEPDADRLAEGADGASPADEVSRPKPKRRSRKVPTKKPRPSRGTFIPTDI